MYILNIFLNKVFYLLYKYENVLFVKCSKQNVNRQLHTKAKKDRHL